MTLTEKRRFVVEATPEYWAGFHAWLRRARPASPPAIATIPKKVVSIGGGTIFHRFPIEASV